MVALLDYDGDGQNNILISLGGGIKADVETGQVFDIPTCGIDGMGDLDLDGYEDLVSPFEAWLGSPTQFTPGGALYADEDDDVCPTIYPLGDIDFDGRKDFARASRYNGYIYDASHYGTMDLYLGSGYSAPSWPPHWRYKHPTEGAGYAVTAADVDGDGDNELVTVSGHDEDGVAIGELQVLDDILDPLGPTVVASVALGPEANNRYGWGLFNLGDLDLDGDDEVLLSMTNYPVMGLSPLHILDAEPTSEGLARLVGEPLTLPLPEGADLEGAIPITGDYDGNGSIDLAVALSWSLADDDFGAYGELLVWLGPEPLVEEPPAGTGDTGTPSGQPPAEEPPVGYACGCAHSGASLPAFAALAARRR